MNTVRQTAVQLLIVLCALLFSLTIAGVCILFLGVDPILVYTRLAHESFGTWYGIGQVLFKSTTFIFTGLAAAIAFRTGLFNIGGEGQLMMGAFATAYVGSVLTGWPPEILIATCFVAGFGAGALWGALPGFLKSRYGAHEVITTIMMNFIAAALVSYLVNNLFGVPATVHTPPIGTSARLTRLESFFSVFQGSPVNLSVVVSLLSVLLIYHLMSRTRFGYEMRVTGSSWDAARYAHISAPKYVFVAMAISGGLAGLGGINFVLGYKHYFEIGFSEGAGFIGIAVALLARNHPLGILVTAIFFGALEYGGLTINTLVPKELVNILQAVIILSLIIVSKTFDSWAIRLQQRQLAREPHA